MRIDLEKYPDYKYLPAQAAFPTIIIAEKMGCRGRTPNGSAIREWSAEAAALLLKMKSSA